ALSLDEYKRRRQTLPSDFPICLAGGLRIKPDTPGLSDFWRDLDPVLQATSLVSIARGQAPDVRAELFRVIFNQARAQTETARHRLPLARRGAEQLLREKAPASWHRRRGVRLLSREAEASVPPPP